MRLPRPALHLLLAVAYSCAYLFSYIKYLHPYFGYMGYDLIERAPSTLVLTVMMAAFPVVFYRGVRALSSVLSVLIYLVLFVPIIVTFPLTSAHPLGAITLAQVVFVGGMCLLFLADALPIQRPVNLRTRADLMTWALVFTVGVTLFIAFVYRGNLRIVSFGEAVYEQRFANAELGQGAIMGYLSAWLYAVFAPLCLAYGLVARRRAYFLAGSAACVIMYMATAAKIAILLPFVFAAFYLVFARDRLRHIFPVTAFSLGSLVALTSFSGTQGLTFIISAVLLQRTIGNSGHITTVYYDFFSFYPQTNWSHVGLVNRITDAYPYGELGIGQVIGQYYFAPLMNANASFWATDGLAAMGLAGVALASIVCALVFVAMNSFTSEHDPLFVSLCFLPFLVTLMNQSLFSSMWSGGGFFLLLFFIFNNRNTALLRRSGEAQPSASPA